MLAILNEFYHITIVFNVRNRCYATFHPLKHSMWSFECIYLYRVLEFSIVTDLSKTARTVDHIIRIGWFSSTRNKIGFDGLEITTEQIKNIYVEFSRTLRGYRRNYFVCLGIYRFQYTPICINTTFYELILLA